MILKGKERSITQLNGRDILDGKEIYHPIKYYIKMVEIIVQGLQMEIIPERKQGVTVTMVILITWLLW